MLAELKETLLDAETPFPYFVLSFAAILIFFLLLVIKREVYKFWRRAEPLKPFSKLILECLESTYWWSLALFAIWSTSKLLPHPVIRNFIENLSLVVFSVQIGIWISKGIRFFLVEKAASKDRASQAPYLALNIACIAVVWLFILLFLLDNYGFDITALITGLGIGGIAIALAVQNTLSDIFAYLTIIIDKPFALDDFIIIDNLMGSVEHIGIKTTRLKSLSGEQLIFSNSDLLKSRVRNFKRMQERRVLFNLGVPLSTLQEKVAAIPKIIEEIIIQTQDTLFDRAHLKEITHASFQYEIVYYVKGPSYNVYMDIHQSINMKLLQKLTEEKINLGYPTTSASIFMSEPLIFSGRPLQNRAERDAE